MQTMTRYGHRLLTVAIMSLSVGLLATACSADPENAEDGPVDEPASTTTTTTPAPTTSSSPTTSVAAAAPLPECQLVQGSPGEIGATTIDATVVVDGLETPWGLAFLPNGDMLVTERPGRVRLIRDGELLTDPVLEIEVTRLPPLGGIEVFGSEGGLLGLLLHPEFETNRHFYVFYNTATSEEESIGRLARYALSEDATTATLDRVILDDLPAGLHHQGGRMHIGPDGMLYVGVGAYTPEFAQDPTSLAGKLLRLTLDGEIPADNPTADSYVFVSGIRNTQGYDWIDDEHLLMVDHGPSGLEFDMPSLRGFDELNIVTAGDNLGWPRVWGCDEEPELVSPVLVWDDPVPPTGALFYRGDDIAAWQDSFLFTSVGVAGLSSGQHLHRVVLDLNDPHAVASHEVYLREEFGRLRTVAADPDGVLYVMTSNCDGRGICPPEGDLLLRLAEG